MITIKIEDVDYVTEDAFEQKASEGRCDITLFVESATKARLRISPKDPSNDLEVFIPAYDLCAMLAALNSRVGLFMDS